MKILDDILEQLQNNLNNNLDTSIEKVKNITYDKAKMQYPECLITLDKTTYTQKEVESIVEVAVVFRTTINFSMVREAYKQAIIDTLDNFRSDNIAIMKIFEVNRGVYSKNGGQVQIIIACEFRIKERI